MSATIFKFCYQVTLSHTRISDSYQPFFSDTYISYLYLFYSHTPVRSTYQNPFVTNHHQLVASHTSQKQPFAKVLQNRCSEKCRKINRLTTVLVSFVNKVAFFFILKKPVRAYNFITNKITRSLNIIFKITKSIQSLIDNSIHGIHLGPCYKQICPYS